MVEVASNTDQWNVIALKWDESKVETRDEKQAVLCTCIASVAKCFLFRSVQKKQGSRLKCKWADQNIQPCGFRWEAREAFHFRFPFHYSSFLCFTLLSWHLLISSKWSLLSSMWLRHCLGWTSQLQLKISINTLNTFSLCVTAFPFFTR